LAAAAVTLSAGSAGASVITPNTLGDEYNSDPATCSLREAIEASNTDAAFDGCPAGSGADEVVLGDGVYEFDRTDTGAGNDNGDLEVTAGDVLAITHAGGGSAAIDALGIDRVLYVHAGADLTVSGVSIQGGLPVNSAAGGIASEGALTMRDAAVIDNEILTAGYGAGIWSLSGSLTLANVTVSGNATPPTTAGGGGVYANGVADLTNVTISDNEAGSGAGGGMLVGGSATVTLRNTIIAGNSAGANPDCSDTSTGTVVSAGHNLIGNSAGCPVTPGTGDQLDVPAGLSPLADNGGPTVTHALSAGGNAVDQVPPADCGGLGGDQRRFPRPFPAAGDCDVGAYELVTCSGGAVNSPGPFSACPQPPILQPGTPAAPAPKKCRKGQKLKKGKCKRKKRKKGRR
jgi:CSLREA domain-containing protein